MTAPLKILHVLRAPVGGLFRHVADLARAQSDAGHAVGAVCCAEASDRLTEERLGALAADLALGLQRIPMAREVSVRDVLAARDVRRAGERLGVNVLHGHGAKGGAYARLAAAGLKSAGRRPIAVYTPHGGSLHYAPNSLKGRVFMALERHLAGKTDGIIFESAYSSRVYAANVAPRRPVETRVIANGVGAAEFERVSPRADAAAFLFVGELRRLKGVDLMLEALAALGGPNAPDAVIVGDGPDAAEFRALATTLGLDGRVRFPGAMPAREAFALGRTLVMPSRAESFPYIVLEAGAAAMPMIATSVGGIPEIVAGSSVPLIPPEDSAALSGELRRHLEHRADVEREAESLQHVIAEQFTVNRMSAAVTSFYEDLLSR